MNIGVAVNVQNESGSTAMHMACSFQHMHVVEWLHQRGGSLVTQDHKGLTPIAKCKGTMGEELRLKYFPVHCAVKEALADGDIASLIQVMDAVHEQNNAPPGPMAVLDDTNHTPLMMAALADNSAMVNAILDHLLSTSISSSEAMDTLGTDTRLPALGLCAQKDMADMVALLCRRGASLVMKNAYNPACDVSILRVACRKNAFKAAAQLCRYGADVSENHIESENTRLIDVRGMTVSAEEVAHLIAAYTSYCNWERRKGFIIFLRSRGLLGRENALNLAQRAAGGPGGGAGQAGVARAMTAQARALLLPGVVLRVTECL